MTIIEVRIRGTTALLQNRFTESAQEGGSTRKVMVQKRDPREEATKSAYIDAEGKHSFPGAAISRLLREAGGNHKIKGSRKSAKFVVPAAVLVLHDAITLTNGDGKTPIKGDAFEVDSRPVVIPATKGRIMRHRPRHDHWSASFDLRINETVLDPDFINQLLTEGGQQIGIGDFRPEKGGPFGCFLIEKWEAKK